MPEQAPNSPPQSAQTPVKYSRRQPMPASEASTLRPASAQRPARQRAPRSASRSAQVSIPSSARAARPACRAASRACGWPEQESSSSTQQVQAGTMALPHAGKPVCPQRTPSARRSLALALPSKPVAAESPRSWRSARKATGASWQAWRPAQAVSSPARWPGRPLRATSSARHRAGLRRQPATAWWRRSSRAQVSSHARL